jgi:predicted DNA-binding ribbon-helix-helix protein
MLKDKKSPITTKITTRAELAQEYSPTDLSEITVERVQLGIRMEKRMVKVLKALAEATDMTLTELFEDVMLHALEGHSTFSDPKLLEDITDFKRLYGMNYWVHDSYRFKRD